MLIKDFQENYDAGWIKIYRSLTDHWIWEKPLSKFEAWVDMILEANYKEEKVLIDGEIIICKRGEKLYSIKTWAKRWGWTVQKVRTFLKLLERNEMIKKEGLRKTTRVTISNYNTYQDKQQTDNTQITHRQHTDNDNKRIKELKNKNKGDYFENLFKLYLLDFGNKLSLETWKEWVEYRREIKKKLTKSIADKQLKFLILQNDPTGCINESIKNGWTGLFKLETKPKAEAEGTGRIISLGDQRWKKPLEEAAKQKRWEGK